MKLWIFSNWDYGYGAEICSACVNYCKKQNIDYEVIFSPKYPVMDDKNEGIMTFLYRFKQSIKNLLFQLKYSPSWNFKPRVVKNVNSAQFIHEIDSSDIGVIAGFNQIFANISIDRFDRLANIHPSILPLYRGPLPSLWCIKNNESKTGFTVHHVTPMIDSGEIIHQEVIEIPENMLPEEIDKALSNKAAAIIPDLLDSLVLKKKDFGETVDAFKVYKVHQNYAGFE